MKRFFYALLCSALFCLAGVWSLMATPIGEPEARHLAEQFFRRTPQLRKLGSLPAQTLTLVSAPERNALRTLAPMSEPARYYYVYNRGEGDGFVIVAGDDRLSPYIGYSTTGRFSTERMPEHLAEFLNSCQQSIDRVCTSKDLPGSYLPTRPALSEPSQVNPLLNGIEWNQDYPWNYQTPEENGKHTPVGCVATAYTQVMRYHKWPTKGQGTFTYTEQQNNSGRKHTVDYENTTYKWDDMPISYATGKNVTDAERDALSTLAYHAGVAVEMMYAPDGSGTYTQLVVRALRNHFRYDKKVRFELRQNHTQASWEQLLRSELSAKRPVVYSGSGSGGGHAFVCDGYNSEGLFHINWGWGGVSDGYFNLNYLVPGTLGIGGGAGGGFNQRQGAVIGITPDREGNSQAFDMPKLSTWKFDMTLSGGDRVKVGYGYYEVGLDDSFTPYNGAITYGVTRVGSVDTTYLSNYENPCKITGEGKAFGALFKGISGTVRNLDINNVVHEGEWDIFLAYRETQSNGTTRWRPCANPEVGHRSFKISKKTDGSFAVASCESLHILLEAVEGTVVASMQSYEKSSLKLQLRNVGHKEFAQQLSLCYITDENEWISISDIIPVIPTGETKEVNFPIERCPKKEGTIKLGLLYYSDFENKTIEFPEISVQRSTTIRPAFTIRPAEEGQKLTANLTTGEYTSILVTNVGTSKFKNRVFCHYTLKKGKDEVRTAWKQLYIGGDWNVTITPDISNAIAELKLKVRERFTLTMTFCEVNNKGHIIAQIPVLENPSLSFLCVGPLGEGVVTMTTEKQAGEQFSFSVDGPGMFSCEGIEEELIVDNTKHDYTLTNSQVTIRGDLSSLGCVAQRLTALDLSQCKTISIVNCVFNNIKGTAMTSLMDNLPNRTGQKAGVIAIVSTLNGEKNKCLKSDVNIAKEKNWQVVIYNATDNRYYPYEGVDETPEEIEKGLITMTTSKKIGDPIVLNISANGNFSIEGAKKTSVLPNGKPVYEITNATIKIHGDVTELDCSNAELTALDVSQNTTLERLILQNNKVSVLDLSKNTALQYLDCSRNNLTDFDLSNNTALSNLNCSSNKFTSLNISGNTNLTILHCGNNQLTSLELSQNTELSLLDCSANRLTSLGLVENVKLNELNCSNNQLTSLALSENQLLSVVTCHTNKIKEAEMTALINSLVDRSGKNKGMIYTFVDDPKEENECSLIHMHTAQKKNWDWKAPIPNGVEVYKVTTVVKGGGSLTVAGFSDLSAVPAGTELTVTATPQEGYELTALTANGVDIMATKKFVVKESTEVIATFSKSTYAVTISDVEGGSLTLSGYSDLSAVPYGTELTVTATPQEGYELTALTASGVDIMATKKFIVKKSTEVIATFSKKTYAVTLSSNEHGTIAIAEKVDLSAVPFGTQLTVVAVGNNDRCKLTKLTANGVDILESKRFVVTDQVSVVAEFVDYTAVEFVGETTLTIYPNPAQEYVVVKGVTPNAEIVLYTLDGHLIQMFRANETGAVQIDLSALSDGIYLVVTQGVTKQLIIRH